MKLTVNMNKLTFLITLLVFANASLTVGYAVQGGFFN